LWHAATIVKQKKEKNMNIFIDADAADVRAYEAEYVELTDTIHDLMEQFGVAQNYLLQEIKSRLSAEEFAAFCVRHCITDDGEFFVIDIKTPCYKSDPL
jgi:hypothetical protein